MIVSCWGRRNQVQVSDLIRLLITAEAKATTLTQHCLLKLLPFLPAET